jgi:hypothetical protein
MLPAGTYNRSDEGGQVSAVAASANSQRCSPLTRTAAFPEWEAAVVRAGSGDRGQQFGEQAPGRGGRLADPLESAAHGVTPVPTANE